MEYRTKEISAPCDTQLSAIVSLWRESFGDSEEFIRDFFKKMPIHSTVCCFYGDIPVSMAVLLACGDGYYGYAVCTDGRHRNKGLCRRIHSYIKEKCEREGREYFVHPADGTLCTFYARMGMSAVLSVFEVKTVSYDREKVGRCSPSEYYYIRDLYFGGFGYFPWSVEALSFMEESGTEFYSSYIDGILCGAAVSEGKILELCAPDHLSGRAASAFLFGSGKLGTVRFITESTHADEPALMSFSGKGAYFNLFFE